MLAAGVHLIRNLASSLPPSTILRGTLLHQFRHSPITQLQRRKMSTAMGKRLQGKTIVITGASSGIGRSIAIEFARTSPKDLKLVLTARRVDKLKEVAEEIKKELGDGVKVLPFQLDVSIPAEVRGFVEALPVEFKEIDILVNNA